MKEIVNKYKKGTIVTFGDNEAIISSELRRFNEFYYIIADITKNINFKSPCSNIKIEDKVALIIRNKELLLKMGLSAEERKAIYCHELGHCFGNNQQTKREGKVRDINEEIECDTFAVEKCGISPKTLESALKKTYEYEIKHINEKEGLTQEKLDRFVNEMRLRKRNAERLIKSEKKEELEK